jgi:hypothetical protein
MVTKALIFAGMMLAALPATAQSYSCKMSGFDAKSGWISEVINFNIDKASGEIIVNDGIIQYFMKKQLTAKVSELGDTRAVFKWSVDTHNDAGQRSRIAYRATFTPETKKLRVNALPGGYSNSFFGNGDCVKQ